MQGAELAEAVAGCAAAVGWGEAEGGAGEDQGGVDLPVARCLSYFCI